MCWCRCRCIRVFVVLLCCFLVFRNISTATSGESIGDWFLARMEWLLTPLLEKWLTWKLLCFGSFSRRRDLQFLFAPSLVTLDSSVSLSTIMHIVRKNTYFFRFLVMSVPLDSEPQSHDELVDHWHEMLKEGNVANNVDEHKLKCVVAEFLALPEAASSPKESVHNLAFLIDKLENIDSKLDYLLVARKQRTVQQTKMRWNLMTIALGLVLFLLCARIVSAVFSSGKENLLS